MKNNFLESLKKESSKTETANGAEAYSTTNNHNLDLFSVGSRNIDIKQLVKSAWAENRELAMANILYLLDIRNGKGERKHFLDAMMVLKELGVEFSENRSYILTNLIVHLGRTDYAIKLAYVGILDKECTYSYLFNWMDEKPLIAKWMPSINTSSKVTRLMAKDICRTLGLTPRNYRKGLSFVRDQLNLVETNLSKKEYDKINYSHVPTKAMLKYRNAFKRHDNEKYTKFFEDLKNGVEGVKINTTGLFVYEIIQKICNGAIDVNLAEQMWKNQKDFIPEKYKDVKAIVVADTSGSMTYHNYIPLSTSIGLSIYFAERNTGEFKNHFITFSERAKFVEIKGNNIVEKYNSFKQINENTNIQSVYDLILKTAKDNNLTQSDLPEYLIIVSDMQFDKANDGIEVNFELARQKFEHLGYKLPKIIFWNVSDQGNQTFEVQRNDSDVAIVGGFSTSIFQNLFTLEKLTPENQMLETLKKYLDLFKLNDIINM